MTEKKNAYKKRGVDYSLQTGQRTLPGKYYHSQEIFQEEVEKIFYTYWQYACQEEEIKSIGDFKQITIADEHIILVRDKSNKIQALFNVCMHRGTQICTADSGHFKGNTIQCPYHRWTYDLNGKLLRAPLMEESESFKKDECQLNKAHIHIWEGFIFISLAENPTSFETQMEALIGKFDDWKMADLRIAHHIRYELNCNWKLILQNYQECLHCPGVHPLLTQLTPFQSAHHDFSKGAVIGGFMDLTKERGSMTMDGEAAAPPLCSKEDLQRIYYYSVFPNMLLTPHPDFVLFHHIIPLGPERIINNCYWLFHPNVINDKSAQDRIKSAVEFWDLTNKQDWQVCEQMQIGTKSKRFTRGHYAASEDILAALDRELLNALGHEL